MKRFCILCSQCLVACLFAVAPAAAGGPLRAGAAVVDITPPTGHAMWGYAARKDAPCIGVLDPLKARALVLEAGTDRLALVSLDLGRAPPRASTEAIRARIRKSAGIAHLFLVGSHTHHGPVLELDAWPTAKTSYVRSLEDKLTVLIEEAAGNLRPARLGVAVKEATLNRNRQSKLADKPVDRELRVLRVEDADGKPIAHAVNFAAHPTMTDGRILKFSADWPGAMAALMEKETGAPCLFLQGAAGDLSPDPPADAAGPEKFGQAVGQAALALSRDARCVALEKTSLVGADEELTFPARIDLSNPAIFALVARAFFPELVAFYEREYREGVRPRVTTALLDGRIGFVGVSGEVFCGHSLSLKRRARLEHVFFLGYCNDYHQYFPTIEAAAEGGYGTEPQHSPAQLGAGEQIVDRALLRLYRLRGKLPEAP